MKLRWTSAEASLRGGVAQVALHAPLGQQSQKINAVESLEDLAGRAKSMIQDVSLDDDTMARLGCDDAFLRAKNWSPRTWMQLAVLL